MDALLPRPGVSWQETLPPTLAAKLIATARDGLLAPWPHWLAPGQLEQLLPDAGLRELIAGEAPRAPLSFASAKAPHAPDWPGPVRCAYVRLSEAYAAEAQAAAVLGFRIRELDGHHLSMASDPASVAEVLIDEAGRL
jgi:hypothetical protein